MFVSTCRAFTSRNSSNISSLVSIFSSNLTKVPLKIDGEWIINSISLMIFLLALLGNGAALVVMFGSRGPIRLTNNKYLVNLACADLLRACFMPFTILARMKKNFMFGPIICKVLPIVQGIRRLDKGVSLFMRPALNNILENICLSVAVDVFTLVCISVERYIAICRPLLILKLQSLQFANLFNGLILFFIWTVALLIALPNIFIYNLCSLPKPGRFKCEKVDPVYFDEKFYMLALDLFYFLAPMIIMLVLYTLIICKMYKNNTAMKMRSFQSNNPSKSLSTSSSPPPHRSNDCYQRYQAATEYPQHDSNEQRATKNPSNLEFRGRIASQESCNRSRSRFSDDEHQPTPLLSKQTHRYRKRSKSNSLHRQASKEHRKGLWRPSHSRTSSTRSRLSTSSHGAYRVDRHRRKALKLLIVIIMEFFICWTPLFIYHTYGTFDKNFYRSMPRILLDLILLFSFASPLCNPFTYYFMSKRYRAVLYAYFSCCSSSKSQEKFNRNSQDARQVVKALHLHQQQNSAEYQQKNQQRTCSSANNVRYFPKRRSNTLQ